MPMKSEAAVEGKLWTVNVVFANGQPRCKESVRAVSGLEALEKIRKRYPFADMARTTVAQEGKAAWSVVPFLKLPAQQDALQEPEDDGQEPVPFAVEVEEIEDAQEREPIAQTVETDLDPLEVTASNEARQEWERRRQQAIERRHAQRSDAPAMKPAQQEHAQEPPAEVDRPEADRELFIPSAQRCELSPVATEPLPGLIKGPTDSQGRRTILEDTARAAAMLHAQGKATWDQMAADLGVNTDHLRKRCRRHYPATDQKDGQPAQKSAQVNRRLILTWVPVSTLRPVDAWYPVLACKPGEQWEVRPYGNRVELEKEGFLWAIRLGKLPCPES